MTPMIPKISVSPLATRNSSRPYWTAFRHWTRKVAKSNRSSRWSEVQRTTAQATPKDPASPVRWVAPLGGRSAATGGLHLHLAAARGVGQCLDRDRLELVVVALDLTQVDVLHRVAGR